MEFPKTWVLVNLSSLVLFQVVPTSSSNTKPDVTDMKVENPLDREEFDPDMTYWQSRPISFYGTLAARRPSAALQLAPAGSTCAGSWLSGAFGPLQPVAEEFIQSRSLLCLSCDIVKEVSGIVTSNNDEQKNHIWLDPYQTKIYFWIYYWKSKVFLNSLFPSMFLVFMSFEINITTEPNVAEFALE